MIKRIKSKLNSDSNLKELVSGSAISFVFKMLGMGLSYLFIYLLSQKNGASGVGYYSLTANVLLVCGIISVAGTNNSVLRFVGQFNNPREDSKLISLYKAVLKITLPFTFIIGAFLFFGSHSITQSLFHSTQYARAFEIIGIALPFFALDLVAVEFIRGLKRLKISEFIRSVMNPAIFLTLILIYWNDHIPNLYLVYFLASAVIFKSIISNGYVIIHLIKIKDKNESLSTKKVFKTSYPMMISALTKTLMASIPIFFLEYFESSEAVGIFSIAMRLSTLISLILIVVNTIAAPKFSELFWAQKMDELQKILMQSIKIMFWPALLISIALIAFSLPILNLFGEEYKTGQISLILLIIGQLFIVTSGAASLLLNMSGKQNALRNISLFSIGIQLILTIVLTPLLGMLGAAISSVIGAILWSLLCVLYVRRKLNLKTYFSFF